MADDCIFCKILAGEIPSEEVYSDDEVYAFRDIRPAAPTHILFIPRKHIPRIADAAPEDGALLGRMLLRANAIAEQEGLGEGYRYVVNCDRMGGQEVYHLHLHLLGGRQMSWPPG
jgi:histidine triad (HIT) family protein